ncbi:choline transporter-like protein 2 isoform X1 [Limulus polyphemus]|uniref:Choline transporter-like protein n=1 Tax=Limulus polyphemus TaxID=6850 RepID=A0ABM1BFJ0_LIMPO|nr:choline transporter-like protein 2 isoform X1 [Limulus polyphemus]
MAKGTEVLTNQFHGEPFTYDPEFRGPIKNRSCTDILCLFLFLAFIAGWVVVAGFAYKHGDPRQLLYPTDSEGRICGKGEFEDKPYLFFFDLTKCIRGISSVLRGCPTPQVCVKRCPNSTFSTYPYIYIDVISLKKTDEIKKLKEKMICKNESLKNSQTIESLVKSGNCAPFYLKSSPLGGRCIPELFTKLGSAIIDDLSKDSLKDENGNNITTSVVEKAGKALALILNARQVGERIFQDFSRVWWILILLLLASMVLSFIWILLMRLVAGVMVWLSIICVTGLLGFGCYYSVKKYMSLEDQPGSDAAFSFTTNLKSYLALRDTWLAFAIISGVLLTILLLLLIFLRKRILIAIALIKEGSRAVGTMMSSLFFPIIPYIFLFALFVFWGSVAMYIASAGRPSYRIASNGSTELDLKIGNKCDPENFDETEEQNGVMCIFTSYDGDPNLFRAQIYNLFGLFWGMFFIVGVGQVSLAGAFASYYWSFNKPKDVPSFAVGLGFWRCTRYHLGSVAFGSLIIAIVRMIRVMLEYVDHKLKKYDNKVAKFALW